MRWYLMKIIRKNEFYKKKTTFLIDSLIKKKIDIDIISTNLSLNEFDDLNNLKNYHG